tara:strand:+ start:622 stop:2043 length:1422 start_codon:yes stop_codon:yes gene_type:complete
MASYNRIKAAQHMPIGTIMPWTGSSGVTEEGIPTGWLICNSSKKGMFARDYPLLARIVKNTYGPFPDNAGQVIGVNLGIVNDFPYNPPIGHPDHDESKHVDVFDLPNLNQVSLVDIESTRIPNDALAIIGDFISVNGSTEGKQAKTLVKSGVDLIFDIEPSNNLSGRITGITMEEPVYFTSVYTVPRKLGIDHTPAHIHRPASDDEYDQFVSAFPLASPVLEFVPGRALPNGSNISSIAPVGQKSNSEPAHSFTSPGTARITWYDQVTENALLDGEQSRIVQINKTKLPDTQVYPGNPAQTRAIQQSHTLELGYDDDYSGVADVASDALTGSFPPPGRYSGRRNFYASPDIPDTHRGSGMGTDYIDDMVYDPSATSQPINTNGPFDSAVNTGNTFTTTLNHDAERFASASLRSHRHDAMEVSMGKGSLGISTTTLVNNVSTGTTSPVSVDSAMTVSINPNTPSQTMIYMMRAW